MLVVHIATFLGLCFSVQYDFFVFFIGTVFGWTVQFIIDEVRWVREMLVMCHLNLSFFDLKRFFMGARSNVGY